MALSNDALENKDSSGDRISSQIESLRKDVILKDEFKKFKRDLEADKARIVDLRDQIVEQGKVVEETDAMKENM